MAFVEDTAAFMADFGADVIIGATAVRGLFDNGYQEAFGLVSGSSPAVLLPDASASLAAVGDSVIVGGHSFAVTAIEPDGTGMTRLRLESA
jgi:hypothetical protein